MNAKIEAAIKIWEALIREPFWKDVIPIFNNLIKALEINPRMHNFSSEIGPLSVAESTDIYMVFIIKGLFEVATEI